MNPYAIVISLSGPVALGGLIYAILGPRQTSRESLYVALGALGAGAAAQVLGTTAALQTLPGQTASNTGTGALPPRVVGALGV